MTENQRQNEDGTWSPATAMGWVGEWPQFELTGGKDGEPWSWVAFDKADQVGSGTSRFGIVVVLQMRRFNRKYKKRMQREV